MNFIKQYLTVVIMLLSLQTIAQKKDTEPDKPRFKRLHVGDTVPEVILNKMYNYGKTSGKLSHFKGKALILDFWNHGCSSCISAIPKMEKLRNQFKDDFEVLMVTHQQIEEYELLFKNSPIVKKSTLPMTFSDSILYNELFPHSGEPYHVWIDKHGIIRGMTSGEFAIPENVKDLILGNPLKIPVKEHLVISEKDMNIPKLLVNDGELAKYVLSFTRLQEIGTKVSNEIDTVRIGKTLIDLGKPYYSMLMRSLYHLGAGGSAAGSIINPITGDAIGIRRQDNLLGLYRTAYGVSSEIKVIVEAGGEQLYEPDGNASELEKEHYKRNGHFIYELACPGVSSLFQEKSRNILKKDLENVFGLKGTLELRNLKCLVLFRTPGIDRLLTKGGLEIWEDTKSNQGLIIQNQRFKVLHAYFIRLKLQKDGPVFIDETGINHKRRVDIVLHCNMDDITALNLGLNKYGLGIKTEMRLLPALILRK